MTGAVEGAEVFWGAGGSKPLGNPAGHQLQGQPGLICLAEVKRGGLKKQKGIIGRYKNHEEELQINQQNNRQLMERSFLIKATGQ